MFPFSGFVLLSMALGQVAPLPNGPGKETFEAACSTCHGTDLIAASTGYTHERWEYVISKNDRASGSRAIPDHAVPGGELSAKG